MGPRGEPLFSVPALNSRMTLETLEAFPALLVGVFMGDTLGELKGTHLGLCRTAWVGLGCPWFPKSQGWDSLVKGLTTTTTTTTLATF